MGERRALVEGLPKPTVSTERERDFVYADRIPPAVAPQKPAAVLPTLSRAPLTTRIREDLAKALKRASLERQLAGVVPNTLQDILEAAIEPWLRDQGYLND